MSFGIKFISRNDATNATADIDFRKLFVFVAAVASLREIIFYCAPSFPGRFVAKAILVNCAARHASITWTTNL